MLCLTRRTDQRLLIGPIEIHVLAVLERKVRLGITGHDTIPVYREEVLQDIHQTDPERLAEMGYDIAPTGLIVPRPGFTF